jgi:hypothetical protein
MKPVLLDLTVFEDVYRRYGQILFGGQFKTIAGPGLQPEAGSSFWFYCPGS